MTNEHKIQSSNQTSNLPFVSTTIHPGDSKQFSPDGDVGASDGVASDGVASDGVASDGGASDGGASDGGVSNDRKSGRHDIVEAKEKRTAIGNNGNNVETTGTRLETSETTWKQRAHDWKQLETTGNNGNNWKHDSKHPK